MVASPDFIVFVAIRYKQERQYMSRELQWQEGNNTYTKKNTKHLPSTLDTLKLDPVAEPRTFTETSLSAFSALISISALERLEASISAWAETPQAPISREALPQYDFGREAMSDVARTLASKPNYKGRMVGRERGKGAKPFLF